VFFDTPFPAFFPVSTKSVFQSSIFLHHFPNQQTIDSFQLDCFVTKEIDFFDTSVAVRDTKSSREGYFFTCFVCVNSAMSLKRAIRKNRPDFENYCKVNHSFQ
jgi:hypothetical protein